MAHQFKGSAFRVRVFIITISQQISGRQVSDDDINGAALELMGWKEGTTVDFESQSKTYELMWLLKQ